MFLQKLKTKCGWQLTPTLFQSTYQYRREHLIPKTTVSIRWSLCENTEIYIYTHINYKLQIQRKTAFLNIVGRFVTSLIARWVGDGTVKRPQTSRHMSYVPFIRSHVMVYTFFSFCYTLLYIISCSRQLNRWPCPKKGRRMDQKGLEIVFLRPRHNLFL